MKWSRVLFLAKTPNLLASTYCYIFNDSCMAGAPLKTSAAIYPFSCTLQYSDLEYLIVSSWHLLIDTTLLPCSGQSQPPWAWARLDPARSRCCRVSGRGGWCDCGAGRPAHCPAAAWSWRWCGGSVCARAGMRSGRHRHRNPSRTTGSGNGAHQTPARPSGMFPPTEKAKMGNITSSNNQYNSVE